MLKLQEANAIFSLLLLLFSVILVYNNRRSIDMKVMKELLIGTILGVTIGVFLLKHIHPVALNKLLGALTLSYAIYSALKQKKIAQIQNLGWLFGFFGGLLSGLFSTGSPAQVVYIANKIDSGKIIRATAIAILGVGNFVRVPALFYEHLLSSKTTILSILSLPFFFLSLYLGQKLYAKFNDVLFKRLIIVFLAIAGISLLVK